MSTSGDYPTGEVSTPGGLSRILQATRDEHAVVVREQHQKLSGLGDVSIQALSGQAPSVFWAVSGWRSGGQGSFITTDDIAIVNQFSQVAVSITEVDGNTGVPFIASAGMAVYNVVPQDGGKVTVHWWVGWNSPLHIRLNYVIVP